VRPDVYIGLVGAAGTDLNDVNVQLRAQFSAIGYKCVDIKVSDLISNFLNIDTENLTQDERVECLMNAGDAIRFHAENGDGVVSLVVNEIRTKRAGSGLTKEEGFVGDTLFLIDSLKNPSEIEALDSCYARNYYTLSVYSPEYVRQENLARLIARSYKRNVADTYREKASQLMKQDEGRQPVKWSQDVIGTFPRADYFLKLENDISFQIKRFVELIFGNPFITPTQDEHFMNLARTASLRSVDLSRQVGAVIVDDRGAVISQGYNEVPYPGGGVYFEGRGGAIDNRDYVKSRDPNQAEIAEVLRDLLARMRNATLLADPEAFDDESLTFQMLQGDLKDVTENSRIRSLIEFGRIVHAEMNAICEAARLGRPIDSTVLYCTTFPCHGCARHIIASGIKEVVFIEPYPKSMTKTLYPDEIKTDDPKSYYNSAVLFRPFQGVSPILFRRVFNFKTRKNSDGSTVKWDGSISSPLRAVKRVLHFQKETDLHERFKEYSKEKIKITAIEISERNKSGKNISITKV